MNQQIMEGLGYVIGAVTLLLGKLLFEYILKLIKKKDIVGIFNRAMKQASLINNELALLRDKYSFNRVALIDYHNGVTSFEGFSFKNASMRNEMTDVKTKSIIKDFQNIPCSIFANMLVDLENNNKGYVVATDEGDTDVAITHRMYGVKQAYNFKVGKNLTEGVISLSFNNDKIELSQNDINDIKSHIQKIRLIRRKK